MKKGSKHSEETKKKIGKAGKGRKGAMLGKHHSEETKRKISEALKGKRVGEDNPNWGRHPSGETRKKMSEAQRERVYAPFSEEHKRRISEAKKGLHPSEETLKKLSESRRGGKRSKETRRKMSEAQLGEKHPMWGKHHSEEAKRKMSKAQTGLHVGEKNASWKGGISFEPYSIDFSKELKKRVRRRDKHICQLCFRHGLEQGIKLVVHHIDYDKKHNSMDNLITLCRGCNAHVNYRRKFWAHFFQRRMVEILGSAKESGEMSKITGE